MLKVIDNKVTEGQYVLFTDIGKVSPGSKTRYYKVQNIYNGDILGIIKWYWAWKKYIFQTEKILLEENCMSDISEFIVGLTKELRSTWKVRIPNPKGKKAYVYVKVPKPKNSVAEADVLGR